MQCLYRHFGAKDELLYVGISISAMARLAQHKEASPWFEEIAKVTIEHFATREEAITAEREAIAKEQPKYNVRHKQIEEKSFHQQFDEARLERAVATYQPMYTITEAAIALRMGVKAVKQNIGKKRLGAKIGPARGKNVQYLISGWQLIDFIENLPNFGDQ